MTFRPITDEDRWAFNNGDHTAAYDVLGAHIDGDGVVFRVWAPDASAVEVVGDFDGWTGGNPLGPSDSGIWEGRVPLLGSGVRYKYRITGADGRTVDKADPYAVRSEEPPLTASIVWELAYEWQDSNWMASRAEHNSLEAPISIYEVHLGSWRYEPGGYRALAQQLVQYVTKLGFTHVELLPVMEHPFYGSWGYQSTGYFAASARYGCPQDLMFLVDLLHQNDIGVIFDWVPSHFPRDEFALSMFDGTHLYEHPDVARGYHPDWDSLIFNYGRNEVKSFLISSAHFWLDKYHADGIRVDAVASMLYLDYSRSDGEWKPNVFGGNENLEAAAFLRQLNTTAYGRFAGIQMFAEESTAFPNVSKPVDHGGLGFGEKWDMGWMNDTLEYIKRDPIYRSHHHSELTFRNNYAFSENFTLPLSHDEVVHGKGSLLDKMPGDLWQKFAGLRLLFGYQYATSGKKLLFMGGELGAAGDWNHETELDWGVLQNSENQGVNDWVAAVNKLYRGETALHELDHMVEGTTWVVGDDNANSVYAFTRNNREGTSVLVVCNFTSQAIESYEVGVADRGPWTELLNSDDLAFCGSGVVNSGELAADGPPAHSHPQSLSLRLPPLAITFLKVVQ